MYSVMQECGRSVHVIWPPYQSVRSIIVPAKFLSVRVEIEIVNIVNGVCVIPE